jgi:putative acetyltransferase
MLIIRTETAADYPAVYGVNQRAFNRTGEAELVDALRKNARPYISLVAELNGRVVGHIFFSPVVIESEAESFNALGLAPMAVLPEHQNQGIGSELVRRGLEACKSIGHDVAVVLGHPEYYPRFGFIPAKQKGISCEFDVPDEVFMIAELKEGALAGRRGIVKYMPEFKGV